MNPIASLDLIAILINLVTILLLIKNKNLNRNIKSIAATLLIFTMTYNVFLFIQWSGISSKWDTAEDIIGVLGLMWWAFLFYALLQNITEQKLLETKERFKRLVDNIPGAVYSCELEKKWMLQYVSDKIKTLSGYDVTDFTGQNQHSYSSVIHPEDRDMVWEKINHATKLNLPFSIDYRIIHKNGQIRWVNEKGITIKNKKGKPLWLDGVIFDITKSKQAEKELRKSQKMLQSVLDTVPVRVFWKDVNSTFIGCNKPFAQDAGFSSPEKIVGKNDYDMVWKQNAKHYRKDDLSVIQNGIPKLHYEEIQITPENKKRWVRTSKIPLQDINGNIVGILGTYEDISEYKKAETQLKTAHQQLLDIIDFLPDATFVIDQENKVIAWNHALEKMTGTLKKNIIGKANFAYSIPFYGYKRPILIDLLKQENKETESKYDYIKKIGNIIESEAFVPSLYKGKGAYIFGITAPLFDQKGNIAGAIECVRDITERKKAEAALRDNEEKYRILFESANDAIVIFDGKNFVDCNLKTLKIFGCNSKNDIVGHSPIFFSPPKQPDGTDSKTKALEYIKAALSGIPQSFYWQHRKKDNSLVDVDISIKKISIGQKTYLQAIMRDITLQKQIQQERENLLKALAAKNEELESVLYVGSHDLKSPILNIQGFSGILAQLCKKIQKTIEKETLLENDKEKLKLITKQEIPEALQYITTGSNKINILINNLLKVSRISRTLVKPETLDMNELIEKIQDMMTFNIQQKNVNFTVDNLPPCVADKIQTDQIFTNLIDNALKYLDPKRKGKIHISGKIEKDRCIYCVEDNGIGIKSNYQKKVFELFHRLNPQDNIEGEGVGLTIVTRTVQLQNGAIWLESEPDKGSKFFIALPAYLPKQNSNSTI